MQPLTITLIVIAAISLLAIAISVYWHKKSNQPAIEIRIDTYVDINEYSDKVIDANAQIVSIHPREMKGLDPDETVVKLRLAVKENDNGHKIYDVKWKIKNFTLSEFRQGLVIPVKVYENLVFPVFEGALLVAESLLK